MNAAGKSETAWPAGGTVEATTPQSAAGRPSSPSTSRYVPFRGLVLGMLGMVMVPNGAAAQHRNVWKIEDRGGPARVWNAPPGVPDATSSVPVVVTSAVGASLVGGLGYAAEGDFGYAHAFGATLGSALGASLGAGTFACRASAPEATLAGAAIGAAPLIVLTILGESSFVTAGIGAALAVVGASIGNGLGQ